VWLCNFDPTVGREIANQRPAVVVSPDEANRVVSWYILAPMTTGGFRYASRVEVQFSGKSRHILVDQLRCMDRARLIKKLGTLEPSTQQALLQTLSAFFAP
jgi:mRNA interferase MazF